MASFITDLINLKLITKQNTPNGFDSLHITIELYENTQTGAPVTTILSLLQ